MLRLNAYITIGTHSFKEVTDVTIESSWETFTDTATIVLPRRITKGGEDIFKSGDDALFKAGDPVTIQLGYFPTLQTRFVGYVTRVAVGYPVVIECQDVSWLLKQSSVQMSFESATLKQIIDEGLTQAAASTSDATRKAAINAIDTNLIDPALKMGSFRTVGGPVNFVGILEEIKKTYGLTCFAQDGKLFIGSPYILNGRERSTYEIIKERNIIEDGLVYENADDTRIKIKATSMQPDNTKVEAEAGDTDGEVRSFFTYNVDSVADLKAQAEAEIEKYKFTGFRGSFLTFGEPFIKHGDSVKLVNRKVAEIDGYYLVDSVNTTFGMDGFRQEVKIGPITTATTLTPLQDKANELTNTPV